MTNENVEIDGEDVPAAGEDETEAGLPESHPFFISKRAAAVYKHGILNRYLTPFVSKVGSTSRGHRVALLDGYAGPGRYKDGTAGSPALLAETARAVRAYRHVECHLVEEKRNHYRSLKSFLATEGADLQATPYYGPVQDHLDSVLTAADGIPLFAYLDPFGFGIPMPDVVRLLRRYTQPREPATEVLLNFTANGIRRAGGMLKPGRIVTERDEKTLHRSDIACGGDWWRDVVREHDVLEEAVEAVALGYMRLVCAEARMAGFALPVRKREHHKPVYYLIFFSRHPDGMWLFTESASGASEDWRKELAPPAWEPDPNLLFDMPKQLSFEDEEKKRAEAWISTIEVNLERLLRDGPFVIGRRISDVYGDALGEARSMHVRAAIKRLCAAGRTATDSGGDIQSKRMLPPP